LGLCGGMVGLAQFFGAVSSAPALPVFFQIFHPHLEGVPRSAHFRGALQRLEISKKAVVKKKSDPAADGRAPGGGPFIFAGGTGEPQSAPFWPFPFGLSQGRFLPHAAQKPRIFGGGPTRAGGGLGGIAQNQRASGRGRAHLWFFFKLFSLCWVFASSALRFLNFLGISGHQTRPNPGAGPVSREGGLGRDGGLF